MDPPSYTLCAIAGTTYSKKSSIGMRFSDQYTPKFPTKDDILLNYKITLETRPNSLDTKNSVGIDSVTKVHKADMQN